MVLWISAALAAIAFSLANTVRGETDRTSTVLDEVRGYYLASGAVDRAALELLWAANYQGERRIKLGAAFVEYTFPSGVAHVELIPETAKLDVNTVPPDRLLRLVTALGVDPGQAAAIAQGILALRGDAGSQLSLSPGSSFPGHGASLQEVEELLSVSGITPEVFYGTYVPVQGNPGDAPGFTRRGGLVDCLSVFGSKGQVDPNSADPAVLAAVGLTPDGIQLLLEHRRREPLTPETLGQLMPALGPAAGSLRLEGGSVLTIRATARVRLPNGQLSDMRRTVAALVKYLPYGSYDPLLHVLRWYDTTWSN
jgi:general secretion pathway protein K